MEMLPFHVATREGKPAKPETSRRVDFWARLTIDLKVLDSSEDQGLKEGVIQSSDFLDRIH
jgi:hypothetical protein